MSYYSSENLNQPFKYLFSLSTSRKVVSTTDSASLTNERKTSKQRRSTPTPTNLELFYFDFPKFLNLFDDWSEILLHCGDGYNTQLCVCVSAVYWQVANGFMGGFGGFGSRFGWWWLGFFLCSLICVGFFTVWTNLTYHSSAIYFLINFLT